MRRLLVLFLLFYSFSNQAKSLSLEQYLSIYLTQDESLLSLQKSKKIAEQELEIASDFYDGQLDFRAQRSQRDTSFPKFANQNFSENRNALTGRYTQNTSWGMQASLEGTHYSGVSNPSLGAIDEEYEFKLSQSLWKNPMGSLSRARAQRFRYLKKSAEQEHRNQLMRSCQSGIELYLNARATQQSWLLTLEMEKVSREALKYATNAYKNKLMREMDYLTAQSEVIQAQEQSLRATSSRDQAMMSLINFSEKLGLERLDLSEVQFPELEEVSSFLPVTEIKVDNISEHPLLLAQQNYTEGAQHYLEQVRYEQRSDIQVGVSLSRRQGDVNIGAVVTDYKDESVMLFLDMQWPVGKKSRQAQVEMAQMQLAQARHQADKTRRELTEQVHQLQLGYQRLNQQLELSLKKIEIYQKQLDQAMKLIETGRIEMEDFQRYFHRLLQERLQYIEYQKQRHSENVMLLSMNEMLYDKCKELL